jgi:hypothetical protein
MSSKAAKSKPSEPCLDDCAGTPAADVSSLGGARFMLTLSPAATKLLDTAKLVEGKERSAIIEDLITTDLAGYYAGKADAPSREG